jgi:hypothetical protein
MSRKPMKSGSGELPLQRCAARPCPLIDWMNFYGAFWRDRFDRLETLLNRIDQ